MINNFLKNNNLNLTNISYKGNTKILHTNNGTFVIKNKKNNIQEIYEYLNNKKYYNYLPLLNKYKDPYEIYPYIVNQEEKTSDKALSLIYSLSMLHIKTTTYEEVNLDDIKKLYEQTLAQVDYLYKYYLDLQDYIESNVYMAPAQYLLIRNISLIYSLLSFSKAKINTWYDLIEQKQKQRYVLLNNNLTLDHFIVEKNSYIINWSKATRGPVIYDFLNFFHNEYLNLDMLSLFKVYQSKYPYTKDEKALFLALVAIPEKIDFTSNNYINTIKVKNLIVYLTKVNNFISEEDEKDEKTNEQEFKK